MTRIIILGAGISGLSAGWFLRKKFGSKVALTILEKTNRVGGWIQTMHKEDFLFEIGPHSIRPWGKNSSATLDLIKDLQLSAEQIFADDAANKRYIYSNQCLVPLPHSFRSLLASPFAWKILKGICRDLTASSIKLDDETIFQFAKRRFGLDFAEQFFDPIVSGIYAGDMEQLSVSACFPSMMEWEQQYGSVLRGLMRQKKEPKQMAIFSFKDGLETLPKTLGRKLKEHIQLGTHPLKLKYENQQFEIQTSKNEILYADYLVSALPATALADLIYPLHIPLSNQLKQIPSCSLAVVHFGFHQQQLKEKGFGYLVPRKESRQILGMIWDSAIFPQQNMHQDQTRLTVMIGGSGFKNFQDYTKEDFYKMAYSALKNDLKIEQKPDCAEVTILPNAIPQYHVGYSKFMRSFEEQRQMIWPKLFCLGTTFSGVSINECIAHSARICDDLTMD